MLTKLDLEGAWERHRRLVFAALAGYPALYLACFANLLLTARLSLGRWPRPSLDDPKSINWFVDALHTQQCLLLVAFPLAATATLWQGATLWARGERRWVLGVGVLSLVCWVAFFTLPRWDPGRFHEWFMD